MELTAKQKRSSFLAAAFILFLDNFGFAVVFPIFPFLFLKAKIGFFSPDMAYSTRNIILGLLLASFSFAQFFGAPFFGDIADRLGRKKAFLFTIAGTIIGYILTSLSIYTLSFPLLLISRLLTGFFSGNLALAMAAMVDLSENEKERNRNLSLVSALLGVSWILAIICGAFFTNEASNQFFHPTLPFWISAILSAICFLILFKMFYETRAPKPGQKLNIFKGLYDIASALKDGRLRNLYLVLIIWLLGFIVALQWIAPLSLEKFKATQLDIMWLFVAYGAVWAIASGWINSYLIHRFSMWTITLTCLIAIAILYFFTAVSDYFLYTCLLYAASAFFTAIAWGDSMTLVSLQAPEDEQGVAMGLAQSCLALTQVLGPALGGFIMATSSELLFYTCALLVAIAFIFLLALRIRRKT